MVHIPLFGFFKGGVQLLRVPQGAQGADGQNLSLAAGEQAGAVDTGNDAHFGSQGPHIGEAAAVYALALVQDQAADHILLQLVHTLAQLGGAVGIFFGKMLVHIGSDGIDASVADGLVIGVYGLFHGVHGIALDGLEHLFRDLHAGIDGGLLKVFGLDVADELDQVLDDLVTFFDGGQHHVVGELVGTGFDHDHLFHAAGNGQLQAGVFALLAVGTDDIAIFLGIAHLDAGNGAPPGDVGHGQGNGSAQHGGYLGRIVIIHAHDGAVDAHIVAHIAGEEGADLAVDHAGDQDGLLAGTALAAQEAAGDAPHGIELFFKIHAERKEIDTVAGGFGHGDTGQHRGIAEGHQGGAVAEAGHLTKFYLEFAAAQHRFINAMLGKSCMLYHNRVPPFLIFVSRRGP